MIDDIITAQRNQIYVFGVLICSLGSIVIARFGIVAVLIQLYYSSNTYLLKSKMHAYIATILSLLTHILDNGNAGCKRTQVWFFCVAEK